MCYETESGFFFMYFPIGRYNKEVLFVVKWKRAFRYMIYERRPRIYVFWPVKHFFMFIVDTTRTNSAGNISGSRPPCAPPRRNL